MAKINLQFPTTMGHSGDKNRFCHPLNDFYLYDSPRSMSLEQSGDKASSMVE